MSLRTSAHDPAQNPGRSAVTWIGRSAGDSRATRQRHPPAGQPSGARGRRTRPAPAPAPSAGRRCSRSAARGPTAGATTGGASWSSSAPSGHGSWARSSTARSSRSRSVRPVAPRSARRQPVVERGQQGAVRQVRPRLTERRPRRKATRARSCVADGVHGSAASRVARTRSTSAAVVVLARLPAVGAPRRAAARRGAARRAATSSSRRSHSRRRSSTTPASRATTSAGVDGGAEADARPRRACRRGRRRRRTATCASGSSSATHGPVPVRSWNCPGRRRAGQPVGEPDEQRGAGLVRVDGAGVEGDPGPPRQVGGALAHAGASPAGRPARRPSGRTRRRPAAPGRRAACRAARAATSRSSTSAATTHARVSPRPTIMRARRGWTGRPTMRRPIAVMAPSVERPELGEQRRRACRRAFAGGRSMNARSSAGVPQAASSSARPARSTWVISAARWAGRLPCSIAAPQPVRDARLGAPGPAGALVGRVTADRHRRQTSHAGPRVEPRRPGEAAVDDDAHAFDRQRRLGDVGRQHDAPATRRRRRQRPVLLLGRHGAGQRQHVDVGAGGAGEPVGGARDLADAGQERQHVARLLDQRPLHGAGHRDLDAVVAPAREPSARRRDGSALRSRRRARRGPSRRAKRAVSAVADIARMRRSGRSVAAASSVNARPRSVVRLRSWTSSKITSPTPGSSGSRLQPAA